MTGLIAPRSTDLREVPFATIRGLDLRSASRDFWADEAATWDRLLATWAGLDDAAWHLPGAAPSDAGGPDWSLAEHVGHLADWQELAIEYVGVAIRTGRWPSDDDYDGGDFDRFNEGRRMPWATMPGQAILARFAAARPRLLAVALTLPKDEIRGDAAWGWVYMTLHGHYIDHLTVIEPWTDKLRSRQTAGDPFVADPRADDAAAFRAQAAAIDAIFDRLVRSIPLERWDEAELTPGWTLRDHVAHLADWAAEGSLAIDQFHAAGTWMADPPEGLDAWNERHVMASRADTAAATLARYDEARKAFADAVTTLGTEDLRSADGWSWAYDCLHGHLRKHLAMVGPWCARIGWATSR